MVISSAFDFIKVSLPCAKCGKDSLQPLRDLMPKSETVCPRCGAVIDLTNARTQAFLRKEAEKFKKIKPPRSL